MGATIQSPLSGLFSTPSAPTPIVSPDIGETSGSGSDNSGWLSGMGDLFTGIGNAVSSGLRASNATATPTPSSGWTYNPTTGQYYDAQGRAITSTGTLSSAGLGSTSGTSTILLIFLGFLALLLFRRKSAA